MCRDRALNRRPESVTLFAHFGVEIRQDQPTRAKSKATNRLASESHGPQSDGGHRIGPPMG
jgi:hypothetical protein